METTSVRLVTQACPLCQRTSTLYVGKAEYDRWQAGAHVQNAFPAMPAPDRELLITGTHSKCWDEMFSGEDWE